MGLLNFCCAEVTADISLLGTEIAADVNLGLFTFPVDAAGVGVIEVLGVVVTVECPSIDAVVDITIAPGLTAELTINTTEGACTPE
ncbi:MULTISPECIES: hypothetical protein [Alteribacter]|uniref:Uncharacterized protein n=1 Tax=Alteribacter keqinensis TaxID=2483800 RepID=A0A3M7TNT4_9BACI|nr:MULTISPECIES: hypothetical protein [Alteribacter]MBM7094993.1 hypothetical protein [Alteribacter salitolerans]RNA66786.1 hypothetical protein EBO34_16390 [Alteribacter keqinensis]